ncbi:MAG: hypothetical protein AAF726_20955 [Planctomycetota bacterium]
MSQESLLENEGSDSAGRDKQLEGAVKLERANRDQTLMSPCVLDELISRSTATRSLTKRAHEKREAGARIDRHGHSTLEKGERVTPEDVGVTPDVVRTRLHRALTRLAAELR